MVKDASLWTEASKRDLLVTADHGEYMHPFGNEDCKSFCYSDCFHGDGICFFFGCVAGDDEHDEISLWDDSRASDHIVEIDNDEFTNPFASDVHSRDDPVSQFIDSVPTSENQSADDPPEMYLPGFVIHIVPDKKRPQTDLKRSWRTMERERCYRAYIANRESFNDIIVSPSMFLDHLPWR